ncbi:MAG: hypothetical protein JSV27_07870 [Candidatus Bathyarchaeota archaeon]|nr:MAG: hypothetical protein JSV27_07870 [Candidatus Bathyarchaeota archaeon]
MGFESGFDEKIDVIDLIINVLKDHEKKLDELVSRLENVPVRKTPSSGEPKDETPVKEEPILDLRPRAPPRGATVKAALKNWTEFTTRCESAELIAFDVHEGCFKVSAVAEGVLYSYSEKIPDMEILYRRTGEKVSIDSIDISQAELVPTALKGILECGLKLDKKELEHELPDGESVHKVIYNVDPGVAKSWLAYQLAVDDESVLQGELQI